MISVVEFTYCTNVCSPALLQLPTKPELISREDRRLPMQLLRVYPSFPLGHGRFVSLNDSVGEDDHILTLVVFEYLQCHAAKNTESA